MSSSNFMHSLVEHEKSFITSGPGSCVFVYKRFVNLDFKELPEIM